jgi:pimeloyl-ACP methyl ester carboxylesterase
MPYFENGATRLHYEVQGAGEPVLLLAPGGMRSAIDYWEKAPWNPLVALREQFQLIAMDQRNAGSSTAPVSAADGWADYTADQLALLDHLETESCHLLGMCIGGPFILGLLAAAPARFLSAVLLQPVGIDDNRDAFHQMFDDWVEAIGPDHPEATPADWDSFRNNMWAGEFALTASPDDVARISTPMLVLMGDDLYHPQSISREIARLAPAATLVERWKDEAHLAETDAAIKEFLAARS